MPAQANPPFNITRGCSYLPRTMNVNGIQAFKDEQRKIQKAREDEFLSSGERLQKIRNKREH